MAENARVLLKFREYCVKKINPVILLSIICTWYLKIHPKLY